jgi:hypothetical protein
MKRVVLTTTDSNVYGGASGYTYTFPRQPDGTTAIDVVVVGEGKNSKGRVLSLVLGIGKDKLEKALDKPSRPSKPRKRGRKRSLASRKLRGSVAIQGA